MEIELIDQLIFRFVKSEATKDEIRELLQWTKESKTHKKYFIKESNKFYNTLEADNAFSPEKSFSKVMNEITLYEQNIASIGAHCQNAMVRTSMVSGSVRRFMYSWKTWSICSVLAGCLILIYLNYKIESPIIDNPDADTYSVNGNVGNDTVTDPPFEEKISANEEQTKFSAIPLSKFLPIVEKRYGVRFVVKDPRIYNELYNGDIAESTFNDILAMLLNIFNIAHTNRDGVCDLFYDSTE